jgi:hypothetical protein
VDQVFFFDSTHDVGWKVVLSKCPRFYKVEVEPQFDLYHGYHGKQWTKKIETIDLVDKGEPSCVHVAQWMKKKVTPQIHGHVHK